jgi:ABC-type Zn uptake system ZnuABC Zn-binding protein ZnuA
MHASRSWVAVVLVLIALLGTGRLAWSEAPKGTTPQLKVGATIFPLFDLVRNLVGSVAEVVLLMPPGASPHTFDDWVVSLAQGAGVTRTIIVDNHIALRAWQHEGRQHGHPADPAEAIDPHYWLAIVNARRMVQTIAEALGQLDPANQRVYRQRATAYQEQLQAVDQDIRQLLSGLPRRDMATFHPAFGYFAEAYDLRVVASFEPSPGQEPTPRHVEQFLRRLRASNLRVLFVEPQLPRGPLSSVARDLGVRLEELDPLGGGEGRDSYIAMMRFNAAQIAASLRE